MTTKELLTYVKNSVSEDGAPCIAARLLLEGGLYTMHYFCAHTDEQPDLFWHQTQEGEEYVQGSNIIKLYPKANWADVEKT